MTDVTKDGIAIHPDTGQIDVWHYTAPLMSGLYNESIKRIEKVDNYPLLCFWMGVGTAMAFFNIALEKDNPSAMENLKQFMEIAGRQMQRQENIDLGY